MNATNVNKNVTIMVKDVKFTFHFDECIPVLEINYKNSTGYLSPFRLYRFQISGTLDGRTNMGSSNPCDLTELNRNQIIDQIELALYKWAGTEYGTEIREIVFDQMLFHVYDKYHVMGLWTKIVIDFLNDNKKSHNDLETWKTRDYKDDFKTMLDFQNI